VNKKKKEKGKQLKKSEKEDRWLGLGQGRGFVKEEKKEGVKDLYKGYPSLGGG